MLEAKIVDRIEKLSREDWDRVFPDALESYRFFKTLDESSFDQFSFFYILVYDNSLPVGATACFVMDFPIDIAVSGFLKKILNLIKKIAPRMLVFKTLMCGFPMGQGRIGIAKDRGMVMHALYDAIEKIAKEQSAPLVVFKDFNASYDDTLKPLLAKGYLKVESFPSTEMKIDFSCFDEYLKRLSQSSRENLRRNFKKVDNKVKIELTVRTALEEEEFAALYGLYLQTYNRQTIELERLPVDFFKNIAKNMPEESRFFLWKIEGKLAAFAFCLVSGDYFIDYYLGFDYALSHRYFLYFVRFRDLLNWCISYGIKRYEMGATTYEPKRRLDFDFIRLYFYIKHRNPLVNSFSGPLNYFLEPRNFDAVFKHMDLNTPPQPLCSGREERRNHV